MTPVTRAFRDGLRRELPRWRDEGLVSPDVVTVLAARYRLADPDPGAPTFLAVYVLGALLVGAGVISLVAWNWEAMPAAAKLALLGGATTGFHAAGFALWKGSGRAPRLGHALTLLGTLVFGASVGLVAQIFHVSGVWWGGFGAFAAGAFAAGVLLESLPHLLLAVVLGLGVAGPGLAADHVAPGLAVAWTAAAAFFVLAWRTRSRALVVLTALGLYATLSGALLGAGEEEGIVLAGACLAALLATAPLAAAPILHRGDTGARLAHAARLVGRLGFYAVAFVLSFADLARELRLDGPLAPELLAAAFPPLVLAGAALAIGLRRPEVDPLARGEAMLVTATALAFAAGLSLETGAGAAIVANLALVFLAAGRIVRGLSSLERAPFWEGIAVAGVAVTARFLELETALWLKGAVFIATGALVLGAGYLFERRRVRAEVAHAS